MAARERLFPICRLARSAVFDWMDTRLLRFCTAAGTFRNGRLPPLLPPHESANRVVVGAYQYH